MTTLFQSTPARLAIVLSAALALLAGCATKPAATAHAPAAGAAPASATTGTASATASAAVPSATSPPSGLADGIALYNKGDYNGAIKRLAQNDVTAGPKPMQLAAIKYTAFSYCVTSRTTLCRQQFEKALKMDAGFDLAPGEYGHPLWGPVFVKAKKAATARG